MESKEKQTDRHLDTPSEANRDKHINFPEVEEDSAGNFTIDKSSDDRKKQWKEGIKEGESERQNANDRNTQSAMPMDEDDTLGVP